MTHATKHFSEAKMLRWEKRWLTGTKAARIASKRFNKAERKAAKQACRQEIATTTTPSPRQGPFHARYWNMR